MAKAVGTKKKKKVSKKRESISKQAQASLERGTRQLNASQNRGFVYGFANGVNIDDAVEDAIIRAGRPNAAKFFALRDINFRYAGGFSGARQTRVLVEYILA